MPHAAPAAAPAKFGGGSKKRSAPEGFSKGKNEHAVKGQAPFKSKNYEEKRQKKDSQAADASFAKTRKEQKELALQRKARKPNFDLVQQCKAQWEILRQKELSDADRIASVSKLMTLCRGKVQALIFTHDASRIVQSLIKHAAPEQRREIFAELKGRWLDLACAQYGHFIVLRGLKFASAEQRADIVDEFQGHVLHLIRHRQASAILEEVYSTYARANQKRALMHEFYGPAFVVYKQQADGSESKSLKEVLEAEPSKRDVILKSLRSSLESILSKGFTSYGSQTLLHHAISEFFQYTNPALTLDLVEMLLEHVVSMVHTRDGARVAQYVFMLANNKQRKTILKSFKGFVGKMAMEQFGHAVLLTVMETMDDTVTVGKTIFAELCHSTTKDQAAGGGDQPEFLTLCRDQFASRVMRAALAPRDLKHQLVFVVNELAAFDELRRANCKKDDPIRAGELRTQFLKYVLPMLPAHVALLLRDAGPGSRVLSLTYETCPFDAHADGKKLLVDAIADALEAELSAASSDMSAETEADADAPVFHPILKMRSEKVAAELKDQNIDLAEPLLQSLTACRRLREMVQADAAVFAASPETFSNDISMTAALWRVLSPHLLALIETNVHAPLKATALAWFLGDLITSPALNGAADAFITEHKAVFTAWHKQLGEQPGIMFAAKPDAGAKSNKNKKAQLATDAPAEARRPVIEVVLAKILKL